jgi:hypothetical protein
METDFASPLSVTEQSLVTKKPLAVRDSQAEAKGVSNSFSIFELGTSTLELYLSPRDPADPH